MIQLGQLELHNNVFSCSLRYFWGICFDYCTEYPTNDYSSFAKTRTHRYIGGKDLSCLFEYPTSKIFLTNCWNFELIETLLRISTSTNFFSKHKRILKNIGLFWKLVCIAQYCIRQLHATQLVRHSLIIYGCKNPDQLRAIFFIFPYGLAVTSIPFQK